MVLDAGAWQLELSFASAGQECGLTPNPKPQPRTLTPNP